MNSTHNNTEKGQAIVYLVLGIVVFLGFVALAIDGGMVLSDRRHAQNAADAAALAGGAAAALQMEDNRFNTCKKVWTCDNNSYIQGAEAQARQKAQDRAGFNNFTIAKYKNNVHNYVDFSCGGTDWNTAYLTVTVAISATTPSNFLQLIYPQALHNEVEAVTWVDPARPLEYGNAVVALNNADCTGQIGVSFHGTGDVNIQGGGVFSNGCVRADGASAVNVVPDPDDPDTIPNIKITGNDLKYDPSKDNLNPSPGEVSNQIPQYAYDVEPPTCPTAAGWYTESTLPNNLAGLYCVTGNLTFSNGPYVTDPAVGATLFLKDGGITINGNKEVRLNAPPAGSDADPAIPGILFFLPPNNHSTIKLNGTSNVTLTGVVFAPGANIELTGTDEVTSFYSQFIGWNVDVGGTNETNIEYNGCEGYIFPPSINLNK